jgi:hypothetical protein
VLRHQERSYDVTLESLTDAQLYGSLVPLIITAFPCRRPLVSVVSEHAGS